MDWVPLWNRTLSNRKAQSLSGDVFKTWINLLCLASIVKRDGLLPDAKQIAFELRLDDDTAMEHLIKLVSVGLLDDETGETLHAFRVHDWNAWQLTSYTSTPRVQRHREREKAKKQSSKQDRSNETGETFQGVSGNGCNALEEKRREESSTPLPPKIHATNTPAAKAVLAKARERWEAIDLEAEIQANELIRCWGADLAGEALDKAFRSLGKAQKPWNFANTVCRGGINGSGAGNGKAPAAPRTLPPERRATAEDEERAARDAAAMRAKFGGPRP